MNPEVSHKPSQPHSNDAKLTVPSEKSRIANPEGKGLGVVAADFDGDGWMDIYVANDTTRNFLCKNDGNCTFTDVALISGTGYTGEGVAEADMGVDATASVVQLFQKQLVAARVSVRFSRAHKSPHSVRDAPRIVSFDS